jgi:hypothetical protein
MCEVSVALYVAMCDNGPISAIPAHGRANMDLHSFPPPTPAIAARVRAEFAHRRVTLTRPCARVVATLTRGGL